MHHHRSAVIIAVGDELVIGQQLDTNSRWLSARLAELGVATARHITVADRESDIAEAIATSVEIADIVLVTGGLGPTKDDLTRAALAQVLSAELIIDQTALQEINAFYAKLNREPPETAVVQAQRPANASSLQNAHGTAPGLHATLAYDGVPAGSCEIYCFPGPPRELAPMFEKFVADPLLASGQTPPIAQRIIRTFGLGESAVAERLGDLMDRDQRVLVGTTASGGIVSIRVRVEAGQTGSIVESEQLVEDTCDQIYQLMGPLIFGENDDTLADSVVRLLRERKETVAVAESCTGGLLGAAITSVPGASTVFDAGFITYSNAAKGATLEVSPVTLQRYGAVSSICAQEMVAGALEATGATHAIAVTGIAGPAGGTPEKPVGTVWVAVDADSYEIDARRFQFRGHREEIRNHAVNAGLGLLRLHLTGNVNEPLLWEAERN